MSFLIANSVGDESEVTIGDAFPAVSKLHGLRNSHPEHSQVFLASIVRTLDSLPSTGNSGTSSELCTRKADLVQCLSGSTTEGPVCQTLSLCEAVSLLSLWCEMKHLNIPLRDFRDFCEATGSYKFSAAYRTLVISPTEDAFLLNAGLVVATVLQAETNSLHADMDFSTPRALEQAHGLDRYSSAWFKLHAMKAWRFTVAYLRTPMFWRAMILGVILFFISWAMVWVQMFSDYDVLKQGRSLVPLNDTFYQVAIPQAFKDLPHDVVNIPVMGSLFGSVIFSCYMNLGHGDPLKKVRRSMLVLSALYLCRGVSMAGTRLPPSNPKLICEAFFNGEYNTFVESFKMITGTTESCSDMMYSGHTTVTTIFMTRLWFDVKPLPRLAKGIVRFLIAFLLVFAVTVFVAVRMHYSMDVWIALMLGLSWSTAVELLFEFRPFLNQASWHVKFMRWVECVDGWKERKVGKDVDVPVVSAAK
ncbi:sphingomyelin synthase [Podochytrium sp. JEL0797]|nr:sphingomyelin synthase [Podochytrium sp. JEL0797]